MPDDRADDERGAPTVGLVSRVRRPSVRHSGGVKRPAPNGWKGQALKYRLRPKDTCLESSRQTPSRPSACAPELYWITGSSRHRKRRERPRRSEWKPRSVRASSGPVGAMSERARPRRRNERCSGNGDWRAAGGGLSVTARSMRSTIQERIIEPHIRPGSTRPACPRVQRLFSTCLDWRRKIGRIIEPFSVSRAGSTSSRPSSPADRRSRPVPPTARSFPRETAGRCNPKEADSFPARILPACLRETI